MKPIQRHTLVVVAAIGLAACQETTPPVVGPTSSRQMTDSIVTADVAVSSGDALAATVQAMVANEVISAPSGASSAVADAANMNTSNRVTTCYDASNAVVAGCRPESSVRKIVTQSSEDGGRAGTTSTTGGSTTTWSGVTHNVTSDTMARVFDNSVPPVETDRIHSALSAGHDTTTFSDGTVSRNMSEAAYDVSNAVTWKLPRSSNPFPISGSIVRTDSVHAVVTNGTKTETRDVVKTVEIDFPADAQGNVVLKTDGKTCTLNLVTHAVTNCQ